MNTLDIFNFGTSIKHWISTFYTNIKSAVINNGFLTNWFKPSRGVRQGCPLSIQFADDTNLFCADLETVKEALKLVDEFGRLSGLTLNVKKSKAMWLQNGKQSQSTISKE